MPPRPEVRLVAGDIELVIDLEAGARATRWTVGGLSLLTGNGTDPVEYGMYPMAPWAGRLRGNATTVDGGSREFPVTYSEWALHGTALAQTADIIELVTETDRSMLIARIADHPGWPWPIEVEIVWEVRAGCVRTEIHVAATDHVVPVVVGWHPWFRRQLTRGEPMEWSLSATGMAERGSDYLPTGRLLDYDETSGPFDDAFFVPTGQAHLRWPGALVMDIHNDSDWFVVFDQLPNAVCIEPQSGPPNGLNEGITGPVRIAEPGQAHSMVTTWTVAHDLPLDPS
jgi:aldose 1-epimerase